MQLQPLVFMSRKTLLHMQFDLNIRNLMFLTQNHLLNQIFGFQSFVPVKTQPKRS